MDGNGRWASSAGLPVAEGHRAGTRALRRTVEAAIDLGVESLAVYAFSTENWSRPADEVEDLMEIFGETIERELPDLARKGVRMRFIGRATARPRPARRWRRWRRRPPRTTGCASGSAFDYGGRAELVEAARRIVASGVDPEAVDEDALARACTRPRCPIPTC